MTGDPQQTPGTEGLRVFLTQTDEKERGGRGQGWRPTDRPDGTGGQKVETVDTVVNRQNENCQRNTNTNTQEEGKDNKIILRDSLDSIRVPKFDGPNCFQGGGPYCRGSYRLGDIYK